MQMNDSQAGDMSIRDVAEILYNVHMDVRSDGELLRLIVVRLDAIESRYRRAAHIIAINALITAMLLLSAIYRNAAGNRRR